MQIRSFAVGKDQVEAAQKREKDKKRTLDMRTERLAQLRPEPTLNKLAQRLRDLHAQTLELRQVGSPA